MFPADDIFLGPATFGRLKSYSGIIYHSTEGAGFSRAAALGTARWQLTNPGSYNFIIYDGGLLLTVPYLEASGGINPASAHWAPERFPFLREGLSAAAYADPTMHHLQVAFSGRRLDIDRGLMPANMLDTALRLRDWWEAEVAKKQTLQSGHMHWQSNRSDPGKVFAQLTHAPALPDTALPEDEMDWTKEIVPARPMYVATIEANSSFRTAPRLAEDTLYARLDSPADITVIGTVDGDAYNGSTSWLVYVVNRGLRVTHSGNQVASRQIDFDAMVENIAILTKRVELIRSEAIRLLSGVGIVATNAATNGVNKLKAM